ncbi:MAG: hypothetical protein ABEJ61_11565 [Haloferacaceae archaeon]
MAFRVVRRSIVERPPAVLGHCSDRIPDPRSESPGIEVGHEPPVRVEFERVKGTGFVEVDERVIPVEEVRRHVVPGFAVGVVNRLGVKPRGFCLPAV